MLGKTETFDEAAVPLKQTATVSVPSVSGNAYGINYASPLDLITTESRPAVLSFGAGTKLGSAPEATGIGGVTLAEGFNIGGERVLDQPIFQMSKLQIGQLVPGAESVLGAAPASGVYGVDVKIVDQAEFNSMNNHAYAGNSAVGMLNSETGQYDVLVRSDLAGDQRLLTKHEVFEPIVRDVLQTNERLSTTQAQMIAHNMNDYNLDTTTKWYDRAIVPDDVKINGATKILGKEYVLVSSDSLPTSLKDNYYGNELKMKYSKQIKSVKNVIDNATTSRRARPGTPGRSRAAPARGESGPLAWSPKAAQGCHPSPAVPHGPPTHR